MIMNEKELYIVDTDDQEHFFTTYTDFCNFMSENSHLLIKRIEKLED